ncbi:MAG TPA: SIS domain-containing protein [Clostridiales bacterium]|nr:SIS domain-containing protein [Clostridiales bacterium]
MLAEIEETPTVLKRLIEREADNVKAISARIKQYAPEFALLAGRGSSDNACIYGQYAFQLIAHLPSALSTGSVYTLYKNPPHISKALVVGVSQSGETDDVCETIQRAKEEGALTVGITNSQGSTLHNLAGENAIYMNASKEESVCATKSFTASMAVLLMLAFALADKPLNEEALFTSVEAVLNQKEQVSALAQRYMLAQNLVVLGTGLSYSAALETALKLKEACYINAWGMSSVDFLHGPIAILGHMSPVIIFAPADATLPASLNVIERIKQIGAHVLVVSDNKEALELGDASFELPSNHDLLYPFSEVTFAQLFAFYLARLRNINPDKPRYLSKVTQVEL